MDTLEHLKDTILKEYPRLGGHDGFLFECGPHLECFNQCCADVNIFLTPYDVLQMRRNLGLGSAEFLASYTIVPFDKSQHLPTPLLKMDDSDKKQCPFVDPDNGCTIYHDRPWPCRMYPLGVASPSDMGGNEEKPFYFIMREEVCKGLGRHKVWTVDEWKEDQEVHIYAEFGDLFKEISLHPALTKGVSITPQQIDMYWISLYDLDRFREFIFSSSFLSRFDLNPEEVEALRTDDESLLKFGFKWARMAVFREKSLPLRSERPEVSGVIQGRNVANV